MNTRTFNPAETMMNIDRAIAEHEIRTAAQRAFFQAVARSIKVGFNHVVETLRDASEMQKEHAKKYDCGTI